MQTSQQRQRPASPPWKIRTRPCPFYSSGRCLFSDSCAFRHIVKSPLTPVDYNAISEYAKSVVEEPYNVLNNGEYGVDEDDNSCRDWSKGIGSTPPVTGLHAIQLSYDSVTSLTDSGTIHGEITQEDEAPVGDTQVTGLGLTNLHEVRKSQAPVPMFNLASPSSQSPFASNPYLSVSDPPFAFHAREPSAPPMPDVLPSPVRHIPSRTSSGGQELVVEANHPHNPLALATPRASSLLQSRSRKYTVSNQPPPMVDEMGLLVPGAEIPGSPTITLKRLAEANNPYIHVNVKDPPTSTEPELSPFLDTPSIDDEDESPSIAKQRFQRAYTLVTKELRQRVAHLRKSPVTPEHPAATSAASEHPRIVYEDPVPVQDSQQIDQSTSESPSYINGHLHSEPALYEATEVSEPTVKSRAWMKPLRLSTLGTQLLSTNTQHSGVYSLDTTRSSTDALPSTRSSSPIKRPLSSTFSRKNSQNSRENSRKNTAETLASANPMLASPFVDGGEVPPVPSILASPAVSSNPRTQRSGSIHYIHSPSPTRWTPPNSQPRADQFPVKDFTRSVSPTRATRASPSPIEPARRPSLRPKSAAPSQTPSTPSIPTERPKLFFAIASTKPDEVARLLATGEASPNETVGPHDMHALTFAMENMAHGDPAMLPQMEEVVTTLLSYGADPTVLEDASSKPNSSDQLRAGANPLVNYFLDKAHRSPIPIQPSNAPNEDEIPLRRAKFAIVGQEFGLMELARAYAAHSRLARFLVDEDDDSELPFVGIFAGLSGHGKSLLASRVGGLLGAPSYTVNVTQIKGYGDLWSAPSCHAREADEHPSLREFLHAYDRQRAVVVIDEIEKIHDTSLLQSLLVPWETGRLREGTFSRTIDISRTVWLCTSNIGSQQIIQSLKDIGTMDSDSFDMLAKQTRSQLRGVLGASLIARVSTVVPFLPFSAEERLAISSKCLSALRHKLALSRQTVLPHVSWNGVLEKAASEYVEAEGARSIRRSILRLVDAVLHDV